MQTQLKLGWIKEGQGDVQDAEAPTFSPEAGDDIEKVGSPATHPSTACIASCLLSM
jgi:hypothetical protein